MTTVRREYDDEEVYLQVQNYLQNWQLNMHQYRPGSDSIDVELERHAPTGVRLSVFLPIPEADLIRLLARAGNDNLSTN